MKHKIVTVICIAVIVALGVVATTTWHTKSVQAQVKRAKAYAAQQYHDQLQKAAVAAEKRRVNNECHRLQANYDLQPVAVKKTTVRPECDLQMVQ